MKLEKCGFNQPKYVAFVLMVHTCNEKIELFDAFNRFVSDLSSVKLKNNRNVARRALWNVCDTANYKSTVKFKVGI